MLTSIVFPCNLSAQPEKYLIVLIAMSISQYLVTPNTLPDSHGAFDEKRVRIKRDGLAYRHLATRVRLVGRDLVPSVRRA